MPLFFQGKLSRRKHYIINRPFQMSFIGRMNALSLGVIAVIYIANSLFFWRLTQKAVEKAIPSNHIFFRFIEQQQTTMNIIFAAAAVVIFAFICIFGVLYSNRIAGPLDRLNQHLMKLTAEKSLTEVSFRKDDYFLEIADSFNAFVRSRKDAKIKPESDQL